MNMSYSFEMAQMLTARRLPESNIQSLRLLQLVGQPVFNFDEVDEVEIWKMVIGMQLSNYKYSGYRRRRRFSTSLRKYRMGRSDAGWCGRT